MLYTPYIVYTPYIFYTLKIGYTPKTLNYTNTLKMAEQDSHTRLHIYMVEKYQDGNPYWVNVALQAFSRGHFLLKLHGMFCIWSEIDAGQIISNKIT